MQVRFGGKALSLEVYDTTLGGCVGSKTAFGRIPEADDFKESAGSDEDGISVLSVTPSRSPSSRRRIDS